MQEDDFKNSDLYKGFMIIENCSEKLKKKKKANKDEKKAWQLIFDGLEAILDQPRISFHFTDFKQPFIFQFQFHL